MGSLLERRGRGGSAPAFTLAEVLVVLGLFGLIAALAFAPSVSLVRRLQDVRRERSREQVTDYVLRRLPGEMRLSPGTFPGGPAVVLLHRDVLGGDADDRLAFWSDGGGVVGARAWRIVRPKAGRKERGGLYRWILPLSAPSAVDWEDLDPEKGQLLFAGALSFRIGLLPFGEKEWTDEYAGPRPRGIRMKIKTDREEFSREDWLPPQ